MNIVDRRRKRRRGGDRRRYPRVRFEQCGFYTSTTATVMFFSGDVNLRGFFVPTSFPDRTGARGCCRLQLPGKARLLSLPVRVVWVNRDPAQGRPGMGLRIESSELAQRQRLAAFLLRRAGFAVFPGLERALNRSSP